MYVYSNVNVIVGNKLCIDQSGVEINDATKIYNLLCFKLLMSRVDCRSPRSKDIGFIS